MSLTATVDACTPRSVFVVLKGYVPKEEFRAYVQRNLDLYAMHNSRLAHGKTMEDVLVLEGDCYMAVLEYDTDTRL